jgi:type VI secretion system secreted protein Hcp
MAGTFFVSIKGQKQGEFKGESGKNPSSIPILGFDYAFTSPRDPATGQATGRRQHKPITIIKEWGAASVQLFQAAVTNEVLNPVVITQMRVGPDGKESVYMEIRLTDAVISGIQIDPQVLDDEPVWTDHEIERVEFTFRKIEIEDRVNKSSVSDDWEARV